LARSFAEKLGRLFEEVRGPGGRRWENREVVAAINETAQAKISASYLSELLSGKKDNPNIWTVKALADFFGQSVEYFVEDRPLTRSEVRGRERLNAGAGVTTLADRLELLFKLAHEPSNANVAAAVTGDVPDFTLSRLTRLRAGHETDLSDAEAAALAAYFRVPSAVLTDAEVAELLAASLPAMTLMRDETVRRIAFRAHALSPSDQAMVAGLLDRLSNVDPGIAPDELDF
jgi:hypothetical protein